MFFDAQGSQEATRSVWPILGTQFGIGVGVFVGTAKFFDAIGGWISDDLKATIWVWIAEPNTTPVVRPWQSGFAKVFDRVFGQEHLSWRCFRNSAIASFAFSCCVQGVWYFSHPQDFPGMAADVRAAVGLPEATISN